MLTWQQACDGIVGQQELQHEGKQAFQQLLLLLQVSADMHECQLNCARIRLNSKRV